MSAEQLEGFLAKLYVDDKMRLRFIANPRLEAQQAGVSAADCLALEQIDRGGLELAAESFARKRMSCPPRKPRSRLKRWFAR